jgi:chromosome segregation protein
MLKLDRLELSGFKSFVDPVELRFAGGVTGIVGPNGCGKSNLSDAITWVLGEQSAKSMRGETMEDVIFNGAEKRKPLGMGEVTVTFVTPLGFAGSEDGRITVSRRVFRSGESQYRLNGKVVRLKDVKDLLMDTGLGVRAYSVIEQGKIGLILSGKPQERRKLLEEAAGITRYKSRKRIAEVKLEETTANLLRLDDIISEVERNLRSLKRQAGAARRFQEKRQEHKTLERTVLAGRWAALAIELGARRIALGQAQTHESDLAAGIHRREAGLAAARERLERQAEALAAGAQRQAELGTTIEGRQQFLTGARRTLIEIDARVTSGTALAARLSEQIDAHADALRELDGGRTQLLADHQGAAASVQADSQALLAAERAAAAAEERLETLRRDLLASLGQLQELRNRLHREQIESEKGGMRERHLIEELDERVRELAETEDVLAEATSRLDSLGVELDSRAVDLASAHSSLAAALAAEQEATTRLRELETARAQMAERQRLLADLAAAESDPADAFAERLAASGIAHGTRLRERVHALRGWERSLDHFLGPLLDAVLVSPDHSALDLAERIVSGGRAAGVLLVPGTPRGRAFAPDDAAIVASLADALALPEEIAAALPPAYLVESAADAARLAAAHPGFAFLARYAIWAQAGLLHLEGEEVQPGFLARASELEALAAELPRLDRSVESTRDEIDTRVGARARAAETIRRLETERAALAQEGTSLRSRRDELAKRRDRLAEGSGELRREHESVAGELSRLVALRGDLTSELGRLETLHAEREARFDAQQGEVERTRADRERLRAECAGRRGQLEVLAERLRSLEQQAARFERETEGARRQLSTWSAESETLAGRRSELESGMAQAERELQEALELRAGGEEKLRGEQEALEGERAKVREAEAGLAEARLGHDVARSAVEEQRIVLAGLDHDESHLADEIRLRCGEEPPAVPGEPVANLAELEANLAKLNEQLEAIGPVNVLAADEFTAEEERQKFLTAQRTDVAKSVESLRQTIREINQTSSARFKETFALVNEQFAKTFVDLFRGGEAEMRLMDEEDLLESGIEIVARPPGKRLQNLMLLSGGEKALTAIALLFALFRIKPSPFCILDEVDAPLDDVNTLRYVGMLRELAKETQCIVITHNKLTMEVASTLYGVTMEERGVSKLIQVELEEVHPAAVATA